MDFALRMRGDDMVHEVQELDPPAPFVVPSDDLAAGEIERREERRRAMPFVIVRLAGQSGGDQKPAGGREGAAAGNGG